MPFAKRLSLLACLLILVSPALSPAASNLNHHKTSSSNGAIRGEVSYCGQGGSDGLRVDIPGRSFVAVTDSTGAFELSDVPAGLWNIRIVRDHSSLRTINGISVERNRTTDLTGDARLDICDDLDGDGYFPDTDCDDSNPAIHPGAAEICGDGRDNDCNGLSDESCAECTDSDGDGFYAQLGCGIVDCDDSDATIHPSAQERCGDGVDNDCDFQIDEPDAFDAEAFYSDQDGDLYGSSEDIVTACVPPDGYVSTGGDCDDARDDINPGAEEVCADGEDNNCDGVIDEDVCSSASACTDSEIETFEVCMGGCSSGDILSCATSCLNELPEDCGQAITYLSLCAYSAGCLDENADPAELLQNVCIYDACTEEWVEVFGSSVVPTECVDAEVRPCGLSEGECQPGSQVCVAGRWAGACVGAIDPEPEVCDELDNDCNGVVDDGPGSGDYYPDQDLDGWGSTSDPGLFGCEPPPGYVDIYGDCNDGNPNIHPDATELCGDLVDNDCNGIVDDAGLCGTVCPVPQVACDGVCVSLDSNEHCGVCNAGCEEGDSCIDDICQPDSEYADNDGDGFAVVDGDCNDLDASIFPGADEYCDGLDNNCNAEFDDNPVDCTGEAVCASGICYEEPFLVDDDGDGFSEVDGDCNDSNSNTYPGAEEVCNLQDDNCDGQVDEGGVCPTPPGESCAEPIEIVQGNYSGDTSLHENDLWLSNSACALGDAGETAPDVVYAITGLAGETYTFELLPEFDAVLYLAQNCEDLSDTCVEAEDAGGAGEAEIMTVSIAQDGVYYLVVDGWGGDAGPYTLSVTKE